MFPHRRMRPKRMWAKAMGRGFRRSLQTGPHSCGGDHGRHRCAARLGCRQQHRLGTRCARRRPYARDPDRRQRRGHRVFGHAAAPAASRRHRRSGHDRPQRPGRACHGSAGARRAAASAAVDGAEAVHRDGGPGRPGVRGRARQCHAAKRLSGGNLLLRIADRGAGANRRTDARPAGRTECELHAGPVRAGGGGRRAGLDLAA
jgi:hypothetical protein